MCVYIYIYIGSWLHGFFLVLEGVFEALARTLGMSSRGLLKVLMGLGFSKPWLLRLSPTWEGFCYCWLSKLPLDLVESGSSGL